MSNVKVESAARTSSALRLGLFTAACLLLVACSTTRPARIYEVVAVRTAVTASVPASAALVTLRERMPPGVFQLQEARDVCRFDAAGVEFLSVGRPAAYRSKHVDYSELELVALMERYEELGADKLVVWLHRRGKPLFAETNMDDRCAVMRQQVLRTPEAKAESEARLARLVNAWAALGGRLAD